MKSRSKAVSSKRRTASSKTRSKVRARPSASVSSAPAHFVSRASIPASSATLSSHPHVIFQKFAQALRMPFLMASLIPILAAGALAWQDGVFHPVLWAMAGLAVILAHAGTNLANDYFDYVNGNYPHQKRGPTGGSFAIQHGHFAPQQIVAMALTCFLLSLLLFAYLAIQGSVVVMVLGVIGVAIGFFYTAPPLQLGYRHLGEVATFIGMGPVLFQTMYVAQTGYFSVSGWALSTFLGLLVSNILLIAQLPDVEEDRASGKRTIASVWGVQVLASVFLGSALFGALALIYGVTSLGLPPATLIGLAGTLYSLRAYSRLRNDQALAGLDDALKALQVGGLLVILGLLLFPFSM